MRTKAPVHRSSPWPSRTVVQAPTGRRHQGPASPPPRARRQARQRVAHRGCSRRRPAPGQGARGADLSAPMIPLTLRAMHSSPHPHARRLAAPVAALFSVLALLAFACFPLVAQAEGPPNYEVETAPVPGETVSPQKKPQHKNHSQAESSPEAEASGGSPGAPSGGQGSGPSGNGGGSADTGNNPSTGNEGGTGQRSQGNGSPKGSSPGGAKLQNAEALQTSSQSDGGSSSPLVPILIAIAVLAAITIGAVVIRQRRQRGEPGGGQVSPKAS